MVKKYRFGNPFATEAVVKDVPVSEGKSLYGEVSVGEGFSFSYSMAEGDIVYGLGEANRGLNKRGYCYVSNCTDDPNHTEDKRSLYGAHNFILVWGKETFGLFVDYPGDLALGNADGATRTGKISAGWQKGIGKTICRST